MPAPTTARGWSFSETARDLLATCHGGLRAHLDEREEVLDLLDGLILAGDSATAEAARTYRERLLCFEASVTFLGQVKAGKTSLVNAMLGRPGLLPADVNPWTSVVTSLHLRRPEDGSGGRARFTFFDADEWDRLTQRGGRIGELAGRAGAEDERAKIARQIEAMREKTQRRLGRRFELLLGTSHDYGSFDESLIERYVCMGDDDLDAADSEGTGADQGRFADITKAADLWLPQEDLPLGLCLRDTPGVNDTFMIREQITIGAIRGSRLCVVVLSAHQALSSVDMALIRLISNVRAREVVIFVNRIDELPDPAQQSAEIRESLRATLSGHGDLADVEIIFGSAHWASLALTNDLDRLDDASGAALVSYAEARLQDASRRVDPLDLIWELSGLPALYAAIWTRVSGGAARDELRMVARGAMNLATGLAASRAADPLRIAGSGAAALDPDRLRADLDLLEADMLQTFDGAAAAALDMVGQRLARSHRGFLDRATAALIEHLDRHGDDAPWTYDPTGLRMLLRSGYQVFARGLRKSAEQIASDAAERIGVLYADALRQPQGSFAIQPATLPDPPAPVLLGQTIALDLQLPWWRKWWSRRRGYAALAPDFFAMIEAETRPILDGLVEGHCRPAAVDMRESLIAFFAEQRTVLAAMAARGDEGRQAPSEGGPDLDALADAAARLERLAA